MSAAPVTTRTVRRRLAVGLTLATLALGGCGKKPTHLDPPEGSPADALLFPHSYPRQEIMPTPAGPGVAAAPRPEPMVPTQAYPPIIRPENLTPNSAIAMPGQGTGPGTAQPWPSVLKGQ